jgi:D-serine deaminase-like pyridoxal phosphate-dependent protein
VPAFDRLDLAAYPLPADLRARLLSPTLVIWLDKVRANVARVIDALGGDPDRWRPHVKTTKIPEVWHELIEAGVRHFKCATTREAQHLLRTLDREDVNGDVLLSHPLVGPNLAQLAALAERYPRTRVSVLVEDPDLVLEIPSQVSIFIDVNPGMDRTGVPIADGHRHHQIAAAAGGRLRGVHYYDGHHLGEGAARRAAIHAGYDSLGTLIEDLRGDGHQVNEVITAGTPAFLSATQHWPLQRLEGCRHRVSPGTVVFHDARSEQLNPEFELQPAALVFTRVISHPTTDRVTCDAGSKSLAAEAGDPVAVVLGHPELQADTPSEEHLPLRVSGGSRPVLGEDLLLIPRHVCPTVNLAEQAVLMDGEEFVGVVQVVARAHDVLAR